MSAAEWVGAVFGVLGALLVALQIRASGFGFLAYAMSNIAFIAFALNGQHWGILAMNCIFLLLAFLGFFRWWELEDRRTQPASWWS